MADNSQIRWSPGAILSGVIFLSISIIHISSITAAYGEDGLARTFGNTFGAIVFSLILYTIFYVIFLKPKRPFSFGPVFILGSLFVVSTMTPYFSLYVEYGIQILSFIGITSIVIAIWIVRLGQKKPTEPLTNEAISHPSQTNDVFVINSLKTKHQNAMEEVPSNIKNLGTATLKNETSTVLTNEIEDNNSGIEERLEQVKSLLERGLISDKEAANKRQSILEDL